MKQKLRDFHLGLFRNKVPDMKLSNYYKEIKVATFGIEIHPVMEFSLNCSLNLFVIFFQICLNFLLRRPVCKV